MGRPTKTLPIKPRDLWPDGKQGSTIKCGPVSVKFQRTKKGKRVVVMSRRHKPLHIIVDKHSKRTV